MATKAETVRALDAFAQACWDLMNAWEGDSYDILNNVDGFPFDQSFDEIAYAVAEWTVKAREALSE